MSEGVFDPSVTIDAISDILPTDKITEPLTDLVSETLTGTTSLNITELSSDTISIIMVLSLLCIILISYIYKKNEDDTKEI